MYTTIKEAQAALNNYEILVDTTYTILHNILNYDCRIDGFLIHDRTTVISVSDGYDEWTVEFPSKYYTISAEEYTNDWKLLEEKRVKKIQEAYEKKRKEEELAEYNVYLELKSKFEK